MVKKKVSPPRLIGRYDVIYADPPWTFQTYSVRGKGRGPEAHYDCMSLDDIKRFRWIAGQLPRLPFTCGAQFLTCKMHSRYLRGGAFHTNRALCG